MNRYDRQQKFKGIGLKGQQQISEKTVGIIGIGALGTHTADTLVRAGIKKLILVDRDYVEASNLQRQTLFTERHAAELTPKVIAAQEELHKIRTDIEIEVHIEHCDAPLLEAAFSSCHLIIDGSDNFDVRQTVNDFCYKYKIPWIYGACVESTYAACPFIPDVTPCFNCVMGMLPVMNRTCDTVGVIEPAVSQATSYQATYALKILTEQPFEPKLVYGDIWSLEHSAIKFSRMGEVSCATCGDEPTYPHLQNRTIRTMLCGRDTVQFESPVTDMRQLIDFLTCLKIEFQQTPYFVRFYVDRKPVIWFRGGRLLVHEVKSVAEGQKIYYQIFG
ncbi:molybdopterin biosynthesis protein MoeB [Macrococcus hajekii]|uniref:Molybdopterin biosynthesis protein MoeB n=1 Tax=Macrococcus hajekii TaxID=198482 RepID=A0A4R6BJL5_9STAP|nr:ThiF family adenylyltransferase [Macrococcus hajekii]TDM01899.1 molybdopterin biosynthesis protein MoeB [Macrococcus hajekii]GGB08385.1 molybdopterin biosynthesis protein MoeB [Macrococcus hajekii]